MLAPVRFTPVRSAPDKRAPERFAPVMVAPEKCAPVETDPARFANARFELSRRVRDSFACVRLAVARSARARFRPASCARGQTVHAFFGAILQLDLVGPSPAANPTEVKPAVMTAQASRSRRTIAKPIRALECSCLTS